MAEDARAVSDMGDVGVAPSPDVPAPSGLSGAAGEMAGDPEAIGGTRGIDVRGPSGADGAPPEIGAGKSAGDSGWLEWVAREEARLAKVKSTIQGVLDDRIGLETDQQKGNFAEMKADLDYYERGYVRISRDSVNGLDDPMHHGIDAVYYKEGGHPPYIVVESKYGTSDLGWTDDHTVKQMSDRWIKDRLWKAVGEKKAAEIQKAGYQRELYRVKPNGKGGYATGSQRIVSKVTETQPVKESSASITRGQANRGTV